MNLTQLSSSDFTKIGQLLKRKESLLERVAKVDRKLAAFESGEPVVARKTVKKAGKRGYKISAAGRKSIAAAQKARWAKINSKKAGKKVVVKKARKKMSAKGRANIAAARKAYWAKIKAEKGK